MLESFKKKIITGYKTMEGMFKSKSIKKLLAAGLIGISALGMGATTHANAIEDYNEIDQKIYELNEERNKLVQQYEEGRTSE